MNVMVSHHPSSGSWVARFTSFGAAFLALAWLTACQSSKPTAMPVFEEDSVTENTLSLKEGDALKISFPGAPELNTTQQIRPDGKISLPLAGELNAVGKTPNALEKEILKLYGDQLRMKEVSVVVESAVYPVFVSGAVLRPGKILCNHPITLLEAIMEAGGFDITRAKIGSVVVIRKENGRQNKYVVNLKPALSAQSSQPFYLKPSDIVYVPEKFSLF